MWSAVIKTSLLWLVFYHCPLPYVVLVRLTMHFTVETTPVWSNMMTPCQIVTTPTQPQLNSKVVCDTKITLHHHHHNPPPLPTTTTNTYHKLNVINISAVPDPILTKL